MGIFNRPTDVVTVKNPLYLLARNPDNLFKKALAQLNNSTLSREERRGQCLHYLNEAKAVTLMTHKYDLLLQEAQKLDDLPATAAIDEQEGNVDVELEEEEADKDADMLKTYLISLIEYIPAEADLSVEHHLMLLDYYENRLNRVDLEQDTSNDSNEYSQNVKKYLQQIIAHAKALDTIEEINSETKKKVNAAIATHTPRLQIMQENEAMMQESPGKSLLKSAKQIHAYNQRVAAGISVGKRISFNNETTIGFFPDFCQI